MCWLFNKLFNKKKKAKPEVKPKVKTKSKPFYCRTFRALRPETIFNVAGREYQKTWDDKAKDLETGEEKWINSDILCMIYLEDKKCINK
jgi:hypothetical protein